MIDFSPRPFHKSWMLRRLCQTCLILAMILGFAPEIFALYVQYPSVDARLQFTRKSQYKYNRFNYMKGNTLPQAKKDRICTPHGLSRCLGKTRPKNNLPQVRYSNRIAEQNEVHPYLRLHYRYKVQQNF